MMRSSGQPKNALFITPLGREQKVLVRCRRSDTVLHAGSTVRTFNIDIF